MIDYQDFHNYNFTKVNAFVNIPITSQYQQWYYVYWTPQFLSKRCLLLFDSQTGCIHLDRIGTCDIHCCNFLCQFISKYRYLGSENSPLYYN